MAKFDKKTAEQARAQVDIIGGKSRVPYAKKGEIVWVVSKGADVIRLESEKGERFSASNNDVAILVKGAIPESLKS